MMVAVLVLVGSCLVKSPQTVAQMTDVQQPAPSPSQSGQVMSSQDVDLLRQDIQRGCVGFLLAGRGGVHLI
jgi:hypothetical protein